MHVTLCDRHANWSTTEDICLLLDDICVTHVCFPDSFS